MIEMQTSIPETITRCLSRRQWQQMMTNHRQILAEIVDPYLQKKQQQHKDPILDFLFEYYAFRPSYLKRWSPGLHLLLEQADRGNAPDISELTITEKRAFLDPGDFPENRKKGARWILDLLENSLQKEPSFGCLGMHEWAMVYRTENVRHHSIPLRMNKKALTEFVESRPLLCTHFDAFRFFTEPAKPMNKFNLSRENSAHTEQAGCLHTNMDLYKWSFKLFPWISSDTIRQAFLLAVDTRRVDMKASPYDLRDRGMEPIKIETREGRLQYIQQQKEIYRRALPIRRQLIEEYKTLIARF